MFLMKHYQNKTISSSEDQNTAARKWYGTFVILKLKRIWKDKWCEQRYGKNEDKNKKMQKVGDTVIGTHFIDLSSISSDGEKVEKVHHHIHNDYGHWS